VRFEWDPRKAQDNRLKHGVTFQEAAECFADSLAMLLEDQVHPDRLMLIGQSRSCRLIFTEQEGEVVRIISARKTTRAERRKYEEGDF